MTESLTESLRGIRGLMNHVADWSGKEIDCYALRNDPTEREWFIAEVKCLEQTLAEAYQQITDSVLERCRGRLPRVATRYIESGGLRATSWSKFVLDRAGELHQALIQLAAQSQWYLAERFVQKISAVDWELVSQELDAELKWLASLPEKPPGGNDAGGGKVGAVGKLAKGNRGRRKGAVDSNVKHDQRIAEAWAKGFGEYASQEKLATAFGITKRDVVTALDRHRKRLPTPETIRDGKRRQAK